MQSIRVSNKKCMVKCKFFSVRYWFSNVEWKVSSVELGAFNIEGTVTSVTCGVPM